MSDSRSLEFAIEVASTRSRRSSAVSSTSAALGVRQPLERLLLRPLGAIALRSGGQLLQQFLTAHLAPPSVVSGEASSVARPNVERVYSETPCSVGTSTMKTLSGCSKPS